MKKKLLIIFVIAIIVLFSANFYYKSIINHPFKGKDENIVVKVEKGDSLNSVFDNLSSKGIIKNKYIIKYYLRKNNLVKGIKTGNYKIKKDITLEKFVKVLIDGTSDSDTITVTIPEGYDIEHIANILDSKSVIKKEEFIKSCEKYALPNYIKKVKGRKYSLEGFLFPDTYKFQKNMKGEEIIDAMISRFEYVMDEIQNNKGIVIDNEKIDDIITIASIVEKEARASEEREKIASVFYNRLDKKMKLQSCATVLYALGKHKDKLYLNDLKVESPYNTYKVDGLPIGPICSPGKESIESSINTPKSEYLYFVLQKNGRHFFTNNYNKFLEAKKNAEK